MSTLTTFPPIESPLDLSPEEFVAAARERGIGFIRRWVWMRERRCGCLVGVAAVLRRPELADQGISGTTEAATILATGDSLTLAAGFDGDKRTYPDPERRARYAYGRAVARAAGLD